jgi:hypothetical protein
MKIQELATVPLRNGKTVKASSWRAVEVEGVRQIWHYSTLMAEIANGTLTQVSNGWGSMSDKQGMGKIRKGCRLAGITEK